MKKEKKENDAVQQAIDNFSHQKTILLRQGYSCKEEIVSVLVANVMALLLALPLIVAAVFVYGMMWKGITLGMYGNLLVLALWLISIPIHEGLRGLGWSCFCKEHFKSIRFGMMWSKLTPYCNCKEPLKFHEYLLGGVLPLIVLGIIPCVIGIIVGNSNVLSFGVLGVIAAGGDIFICLCLLKHPKSLFLDHPNQCGFVAFEKTNV